MTDIKSMAAPAQEKTEEILKVALERGASDIHIKSGKIPAARINGELAALSGGSIFEAQDILNFVEATCPMQFKERWLKDFQVDYAHIIKGLGRFRASAFYQRGTPSIVFRHVKENPPTFEQLHHQDATLKELCGLKEGIVLLCGPTGSGKSSTLAAMLNYINDNRQAHVITLEDPIEFSYTDKCAIFNQREVGIDTPTFAEGLKVALRQDPDIILVGEMRNKDTFETALSAAETGHLVFGTLHSGNAQQAVQRLFEFFDPAEANNRRRQVASTLKATITQKLLKDNEGGRRPAVEIFRMDVLGKRVIEQGDFEKIGAVIEAGKESGSKSFNADLLRLIKDGAVSKEVGLAASPNPKGLEMNLKGIFLSQGGIVN